MVTTCLQCGDVGFDNAYVYCVKCVNFAVHRYCLPEIPKTSDEYVRWVCDYCEAVSSRSVLQKVLLHTTHDICTERVISACTSGSNKKSISQSSLREDENYGPTRPLLLSVHENLGPSGDALLANDFRLSGVEPNANCDWSRKENVPTKDDHQNNTSHHFDEVDGVNVAADESLQRTKLSEKAEVSPSLSGKEKQRLPTTSGQKTFDNKRQSVTSRHHEEEAEEVVADKLSKRNFRKNSDTSSSVSEKDKQRQTTSDHFPVSSQKRIEDAGKSRFSPLRNEHRSNNSARINGVEATEKESDGTSQRRKLALKRHSSTPVTRKEKQMRWSTSRNQSQSRQSERFGDRSSRYPPSRNEPKKDRSHSVVNIAKQRYNGPSSSQTHEERKPMHNTVREREREHLKEDILVIPTRVNEEVSQQTHEGRGRMHNTVWEKDKEPAIEGSLVIPSRRNLNEEVSRQPHGARRPMHSTSHERYKERVKEEALVIPTRGNGNNVSQQTHEARRLIHNSVSEKDRARMKEESLSIPSRSSVNEEVSRQPHEARKPMHNTDRERYKERVKESSVIPTRTNGNEEVSCDPIITPPIPLPSGPPVQVQPVVDPIWRGRFVIVNKKDDTFEGFVAHLSSRACPQVIEEAGLLPAFLQLEMVPKSTVWPKSFQTIKPNDDNIALYIFPAARRYEKVFDRLVHDMSDHDLAMRTNTENAELLIFSSTELPMEYWRFKNKYFIWGVFKGKRPTSYGIPENHVNANPGQHVNRAARS